MREIVNEIKALQKEARELAHSVLSTPRSEREYLVACGRYRELLRQAKSLNDRFVEERQEDPEEDLDDEPQQRRAAPQRDRLGAHRARHVPRSV